MIIRVLGRRARRGLFAARGAPWFLARPGTPGSWRGWARRVSARQWHAGLVGALGRALSRWRGLAVPPQCPACHVRLSRGPAFCRKCGRDAARKLRRPPRVWLRDGGLPAFPVIAAGPLAGSWGRAVRAYKADPAPGVAGVVLPPMLRVARRARNGLRIASGEPVTLVPVPMAAVRRRERGFNPAEELARALAAGTGWTSVPDGARAPAVPAPAARSLRAAAARGSGGGVCAPGRERPGSRVPASCWWTTW